MGKMKDLMTSDIKDFAKRFPEHLPWGSQVIPTYLFSMLLS